MSHRPTPTVSFLPARAKLWIGSLDNPKLEVRAQYNPKELQIDKQIPWEDHKTRENPPPSKDGSKPSKAQDDAEFNGAPKRSMTIELLFDTYELAGDSSGPARSVQADIEALEKMSSVVIPTKDKDKSGKEFLRRPHHCVVVWGSSTTGIRPFRCVIESLTVKYTMWDHAGTPLRAICTVKVKEVLHMKDKADDSEKIYGERRRGPGWDRADPSALDPKWRAGKMPTADEVAAEAAKYAEEAARRLNSFGSQTAAERWLAEKVGRK